MSMYTTGRVLLVACALSGVASLACSVLGVAIHSGTFGGEGAIAFGTCFMAGVLGFLFTDLGDKPGPRLTRQHRKVLRTEQSRIALNKCIAELKKQAGLR